MRDDGACDSIDGLNEVCVKVSVFGTAQTVQNFFAQFAQYQNNSLSYKFDPNHQLNHMFYRPAHKLRHHVNRIGLTRLMMNKHN